MANHSFSALFRNENLAVLLAAFATASAWARPTVDPTPFAAHDHFGEVQLSPDGRHLAVERVNELGSSLMIVVADSLETRSETRFRSNEGVDDIHWADNDTILISRNVRRGGLETPRPTGEIFALSTDGKRQDYLFGYRAAQSKRNRGRNSDNGYAQLISTPREAPGTALLLTHDFEDRGKLHEQPAVIRVDTHSGARKELTRVPIAAPAIVSDVHGNVRYAYGLGSDLLPVLYRFDQNSRQWQRQPRREGELGSVKPLQFLPDQRHFLALSNARGEADCLYLMDDEGVEPNEQLVCEGEFAVSGLMPSSTPGIPLAAVTDTGLPKVRLLGGNDEDRDLYRTLSEAFAPALVRFLSFSQDGRRLLFSVSSDRDPGRVYLHDRESNHSRLVFARRPDIPRDALSETRAIQLRARDGVSLHGFITLPNDPAVSKPPLVVMPHGGPYGPRDRWFFDPTTQWLAANGYAVLRVNFRGSGGFGLAFERLGFRQWGGSIQDDIIDATRWAIDQTLVDGGRVCIMGGSFGAYSALMSSAKAPELYRCAIGYAGVYDLDSLFRRGDIPDTEAGRAFLAQAIGNDAKELEAYSPTRQIERIRADVLLVHGSADWRTPIAHAKDLRKVMQEAGRQVEWLEVANEGHGFFRSKHREQMLTTVLDFLDRKLKKPDTGTTGTANSSTP